MLLQNICWISRSNGWCSGDKVCKAGPQLDYHYRLSVVSLSPFKQLTRRTWTCVTTASFHTLHISISINCPNIRQCVFWGTDSVMFFSDTYICMVTEVRKIADRICKIMFFLQFLMCCATNRKVAGSIPAGVIGIFHWHKILPIALWPWGRISL